MLRPTLGLSKAVHVVDKASGRSGQRAVDDEFLDGFLALETWGNDNVSFPGACYVRYIEELYRKDALMSGTFTLSGKAGAAREDHRAHACASSSSTTTSCRCKSASVLVDKIASTDKELLQLPGGHVGAVVSRSAQKSLWPKMSAFWAARDADVKMRVNEASAGGGRGAGAGERARERACDDARRACRTGAVSTPRVAAKKAARSKTSSRSGGR